MTVVTETQVHTRGRPRSVEADRAITEATLALLEAEGYAAMTMQGVAARAGVSTATLYRRWPCKQDLVIAALKSLVPEQEEIDSGSFADDLALLLTRVTNKLASAEGHLIKGIIGEAVRNPALAQALRKEWEEPNALVTGILQRAVARNEIGPLPDIRLAIGLIMGVMHERWLLSGEPVTQQDIKLLVPMLVRALGGEA
jgi:AcrR family transcriptional regulator